MLAANESHLRQEAIENAKGVLASDPVQAAQLLKELADTFFSLGYAEDSLAARRYQCFAMIDDLNLEPANLVAVQFLREASSANNRRYIGIAQMYLGIIAGEAGHHQLSSEFYEDALKQARDIGDSDLISRIQLNLGNSFFNLGLYQEAIEAFRVGLHHFEATASQTSVGITIYNLALSNAMLAMEKREEGEPYQSFLESAEHSLKCAEALGEENDLGDVQAFHIACIKSLVIALKGSPDGAFHILQNLKRTSNGRSVGSTESLYWEIRAFIHKIDEDWTAVLKVCQHIIQESKERKLFRTIHRFLALGSEAAAKVGDFKLAYEYSKQAYAFMVERAKDQNDRRTQMLNIKIETQKSEVDRQILEMKNQLLQERNQELELESRMDRLSGVLNRRGAEEQLLVLSKDPLGLPFTIAMIDIDHFKRINDQFGHATGDQVIGLFGRLLSQSRLQPLAVGRWGGEEFLIAFGCNDPGEIVNIGHCLLDEIRGARWHEINLALKVTASLGFAVHTPGTDVFETIGLADQRLYQSKAAGRDQFTFMDDQLAA